MRNIGRVADTRIALFVAFHHAHLGNPIIEDHSLDEGE